jgi:hypothetical protein
VGESSRAADVAKVAAKARLGGESAAEASSSKVCLCVLFSSCQHSKGDEIGTAENQRWMRGYMNDVFLLSGE